MKQLILVLISTFCIEIIFAQNTPSAKEWDVLPVPDFFNDYVPYQDIVDIENNKKTIESFYKDARSKIPWIVFSDRSENGYDDEYSNGFRAGELKIGQPLVVYNVKGNRLQIGKIPKRDGKKYTKEILGWIDAKRLILSTRAVLGTKGGPRKGMVLTSVDAFSQTDDIVQILENNHYFQSPIFTGPKSVQRDTKAKKFQFLFILKQTPNGYLLSDTDNLALEINRSNISIRGWLPSGKITLWEHRVCLEPAIEPDVVDKHKNKIFHVIDEEYNFDKYLQSGQLGNKSWTLREIELDYKRPLAHVMRMPILSGWRNETDDNKKIAAIAQMIAEDDEEDDKVIIENKGDKLAELKGKLAKMEDLAKRINILFVIDGTASIRKYGPSASNAVSEFMKTMRSQLSTNNFRFSLGVYRHYVDINNPTYPDYEFQSWTADEDIIRKKLENLIFNSSNPKHEESLFMGLSRSIDDAQFDPEQTNILVLIGDAGNDNEQYKNEYTIEKIIDKVYEKNINMISFQVNYPENKAYAFFNKEVNQIIGESAQKHIEKGKKSNTNTYNDFRYDPNMEDQTYYLRYTGSNTLMSNDIAPSFGFLKYAIPGAQGGMSTSIFEKNLVKSLKDYVTKVDNLTKNLSMSVAGYSGETGDIRQDRNGETIDGPVMSPGFKDYLKRKGLSDEEIDEIANQGEISAQGYFTIKHPNVYSDSFDDPAFKPVIFISKDYKDKMDQQLDRISSVGAQERSEYKRRAMFDATIGILKSILGDEMSEDKLALYTFDKVWNEVLGVPFNGNATMKNQPIENIKSMNKDDFNDFYNDFVEEVRDFKLFNPNDEYTIWKKSGQTYYWIPLELVPGCEENF